MTINFLSQQNVKGKTIVLRCDLNSNIQNGKPVVSARFSQHAETIKQLSSSGAKLVVLAHQGRKGDADFISLKQHCAALEKLAGKKIKFLDWNSNYISEIGLLKDSEIVLMENTRFLDAEFEEKGAAEHAQTDFVKKLASVSDFFVLDALSVAHRSHASVVGFSALPCFAGRVLEKDLLALKKFSETAGKRLLVLGGAKPKDSIEMLQALLGSKKIDEALVGGLLSELFWKSQGIKFGAKEKFFEEKKLLELLPGCSAALNAFPEKIVLPIDFALDCGGKRKEIEVEKLPSECSTMDIGEKTIEGYCKKISLAKLVVFNGPMGVFEKKDFSLGTKKVLEAISRSGAFSILGGGDTETAIEALGFSAKQFGHVSLAGKALLEYLAGRELPGLKALEG